ncbi:MULTISPECIES: hypothetical protein [unclassified Tepidimonas]|uniref:hypothetical protein n=1 Tax=unclassified Tepidimonas TaxID=2631705 RepID=UPI003C7AA79A
MKTKYHLNKRSPHRLGSSASSAATGGSVIALVDERYLVWLASQVTGTQHNTLQRGSLAGVLAHLARLAGAEAPLLRTLLFSDASPTELHDDIVVRLVPRHSTDGGLSLVRALGQEIVQLARHGAGWLLVASDDERLIPYLDEAQSWGARVVLVADDAVHDFGHLSKEDPSWARLLMQADRRVAVPMGAWSALTTPGVGYAVPRASGAEGDDIDAGQRSVPPSRAPAEPDDHWRAEISRIIQSWWDDEPEDGRQELADAMRGQIGVPPEADRRILMRVRHELGRNLTFPEKRAMREMVRAVVLGQPDADTDAAPAPALAAAAD